MTRFARAVSILLTFAFLASPVSAAMEGFVCASSGKRMAASARGTCARCDHATDTGGAPVISRFCCVYVGSAALPPVLSAAAARDVAAAQAVPTVLPPAGIAIAPATRVVAVARNHSKAPPPPSPENLSITLQV